MFLIISTFLDDPEFTHRIRNVIAYFTVLVVIGLPIWWYTTRVYRANLPIEKMYDAPDFEKSDKQFGLPLSLEYDVLISIVHPEPENIKMVFNTYDLDVELQPFLETIRPVANFTVKSQWLYMVELGAIPRKINDHYALYEGQLPHIITPLEKKLWSHMSPRPCINLVVYISRCNAPIHIYKNDGQMLETNAFLSPGWGGILILNPEESSCKNHVHKPDIQSVVSVFVSQLKRLLGINGPLHEKLSDFKEKKAKDMIDSTKRTLKSLAQLLSEISSIVISDEVADKISLAVESVENAQRLFSENNVDGALREAKVAFGNSEAAFSDPSLLALLYFPDDQK